jgi:hypothetical protein
MGATILPEWGNANLPPTDTGQYHARRTMKSSATVTGIALLMLQAAGDWRAAVAPALADEPEEQHATVHRRELVGGMPVVRLTRDAQSDGGIVTVELQPVTHRDESTAYGEVVDIQPLLEKRAAYNQVLAERRIDAAALEASRQDYDRLHTMREQQRYVSAQDLVAAKARWEGDQARADGVDAQLRDLRGQLVQTWGTQLTTWALDGGSDAFEHLVSRAQVLLLVSLRAGDTLPERADTIYVGRGDRARFVSAQLVSAAPATDPSFQGETWFFRADAGALRTGMHLDAAVPAGEEASVGVSVPVNAIVWQGGSACAYVQLDEERFVRRVLASYRDDGDTWFVSGVLQPGDRVVVTGAQMLLSEELRAQIPEEHDD